VQGLVGECSYDGMVDVAIARGQAKARLGFTRLGGRRHRDRGDSGEHAGQEATTNAHFHNRWNSFPALGRALDFDQTVRAGTSRYPSTV
jgi:hypothetical protein